MALRITQRLTTGTPGFQTAAKNISFRKISEHLKLGRMKTALTAVFI
jgi:hypothetical protein